MRENLFRGKSVGDLAPWIYGYYHFDKSLNAHYICDKDSLYRYEVISETVGQLTPFTDKNDKEIWEGDTIRWRIPYRTTQTHYGDNIPNGAYTEPLEPGIKIKEGNVEFTGGMFTVDHEDGPNDLSTPLLWEIQTWDEISIKEAIISGRKDIWDDPEEGDLQYLLEEFKLKDLQALIDLLSGVEIIGNVFEPELLQQ